MVNNNLKVNVGNPNSITVGPNIKVTIDFQPVINFVKGATGRVNPRVVWYKNAIILTNGSEVDLYVSRDNSLVIITQTSIAQGQRLGTRGNYTCCAGFSGSALGFICNSTIKAVCGKKSSNESFLKC